MADFQQKNDLDLRFGGSTLGDFAYFYDVELPYIYKCLNALRRNEVSPAGENVGPARHMFKVEDDKLYIRDTDNQSWIFLLDLAYRGGLYEQGQSLIKNTDLAGNTAEARAGKVATYDSDGNLPADVTGSARKLVGKSIDVSGIEDGQVLVYSSVDDKWIPGAASAGVGEGKTLTIRATNGTLGNYNGGATTAVDVPVSALLPNTTYTYGMMAYSSKLATNVALVCVQTGTTGEIGNLSDQELYTLGTAVFQRVYMTPKTVLLRNQAVAVGDIRYADSLRSNLYLECVTAGVTGSSAINFTGVVEGATVQDGTATWAVRRFSGMSGTIAISDNNGTHTGTATSVNSNGETVLRLPPTIVANITGNVSGSSGSCTGNAATATTAASCTGNAATATTAGACTGNAATATRVNGKTILTVNSFSNGVLNLSTFS